MTLSEYLKDSKPDLPAPGTVGVETDWLPVTLFQVNRHSLWAGDPYVANATDGFLTEVPNGQYALEAKAMNFAGRKAVSRVRAYLNTAGLLVRGQLVGETCTDTGMIGIFDMHALNEAIEGQNDSFQDVVMNHNYQNCGVIRINVGHGFELSYVSTSFGDTCGKVFEIQSSGAGVGFEIEILSPHYAYEEDG